MNLQFDKAKLNNLCEQSDISYLALFGSYARGEENKGSDVDLLVNFKNTKSLLEKGSVIINFQNFFDREIDLVNINFIKPNRKPYIMSDLITLYEERQ